MTQQVLVGVDGSPASLHALDWAAAYSEHLGDPLHLVCTYTQPAFDASLIDGYSAFGMENYQSGAKHVLRSSLNRIQGRGIVATASAATGDPASVLVKMSPRHSLAVVGSRGRSGFSERLLGTVTSAMPAHAACPVVVVPFREHGRGHGQVGPRPVADWMPIRRIVVGYDGSGTAKTAVRIAIRQARAWGAELVAVAGVPVGEGKGMTSWLPQQTDREQVLTDVRNGLDSSMNKLEREHGLKIRRVVLDGTGAELLTEFSSAADLLIVGSRGHGGVRGLLLGSTSQAVLHQAQCPVMVLPRKASARL